MDARLSKSVSPVPPLVVSAMHNSALPVPGTPCIKGPHTRVSWKCVMKGELLFFFYIHDGRRSRLVSHEPRRNVEMSLSHTHSMSSSPMHTFCCWLEFSHPASSSSSYRRDHVFSVSVVATSPKRRQFPTSEGFLFLRMSRSGGALLLLPKVLVCVCGLLLMRQWTGGLRRMRKDYPRKRFSAVLLLHDTTGTCVTYAVMTTIKRRKSCLLLQLRNCCIVSA